VCAQELGRVIHTIESTHGVHGVGLGLRFSLMNDLLELPEGALPELVWLECHPENYIRRGGLMAAGLMRCRERWPIVTHGLSMSLGGVDPFSRDYLEDLAAFTKAVRTPWHSDHLCFSVAHGVATHELLPVPRNERTVRYLAARIREAQDALGIPLAVENVSQYVETKDSDLTEAEFVRAVVEEADCLLLLDVNNVFVNARNFGGDAEATIRQLPLERVVQIHVAGAFEKSKKLLIDTHGEPLWPEVVELLRTTLELTGKVPILLERDENIPTLRELEGEIRLLDELFQKAPARKR